MSIEGFIARSQERAEQLKILIRDAIRDGKTQRIADLCKERNALLTAVRRASARGLFSDRKQKPWDVK